MCLAQEHDTRLGAGLGLNYFFTRNIGIGGDAYSEDTTGAFVDSASASLILRLPLGRSGFAPYAFGGGGYQFDLAEVWFAQLGAGMEYRFTPNVGAFWMPAGCCRTKRNTTALPGSACGSLFDWCPLGARLRRSAGAFFFSAVLFICRIRLSVGEYCPQFRGKAAQQATVCGTPSDRLGFGQAGLSLFTLGDTPRWQEPAQGTN